MRRTPVSRTRYARLFATPRRGKNGGGASPRTICRRSPYHRAIFTGRWGVLVDSELSGARATRGGGCAVARWVRLFRDVFDGRYRGWPLDGGDGWDGPCVW